MKRLTVIPYLIAALCIGVKAPRAFILFSGALIVLSIAAELSCWIWCSLKERRLLLDDFNHIFFLHRFVLFLVLYGVLSSLLLMFIDASGLKALYTSIPSYQALPGAALLSVFFVALLKDRKVSERSIQTPQKEPLKPTFQLIKGGKACP